MLHGKTFFFILTTVSDHIALPLFTHSTSTSFCGHVLLIEHTMFASPSTSTIFLTAIVSDRVIQLHLEITNYLGGTTKRETLVISLVLVMAPIPIMFGDLWFRFYFPIFVNRARDLRDLSFIFKETILSDWFYNIFLISDSLIKLIYALLYIICFSVLTF